MKKRQICLRACLLLFCLPILFAGESTAAMRYTVKSGDNLHKIAKQFHVGIDPIKGANHLEGNSLKPGQVLIIPSGKSAKKTVGKSTAKKSDMREKNELRSSKLKTGQTPVLFKDNPVKTETGEDDFDEIGSFEAEELTAVEESEGRRGEIGPVDLSRWKDPGERDLFVKMVKSYEGVPYKFGGNSLRGIDCSAFTRKIYSILSIDLPRTAREQLQRGTRVERDDLDTGDLVFFKTRRNRIHVGIFLAGNEFFHLSSRNRAGKVDNIDSTYFSTRFISGVRLKEMA